MNSINLAKELNDLVLNGEFTWRDDFRDLHPSPFGHELYFKTTRHLFESSRSKPGKAELAAKPVPANTLDPLSYVNGHYEAVRKAKRGAGWVVNHNRKPSDQAGGRAAHYRGSGCRDRGWPLLKTLRAQELPAGSISLL